ncbi:MAG: S8 family serine peptidase [Chloroflexi bacterium]|nr:S8 family serine peptidase [Chloroflexota bacterium]
MRSRRWLLAAWVIILVFAVASPNPVAASAPSQGVAPSYAPDRIQVKFKARTAAATAQSVHARLGGTVAKEIPRIGVQVVNVPKSTVEQKLRAYKSEPSVQYVELDGIYKAIGTPNDPSFSQQWGMTKIQAPQAWDITTGSSAVKIAILDTGIDQDHEDLAAKIVANQNFTDSPSVDDLGGHGTHVAGIAAAVSNNGIGVAGVGYNSSLMNGKVLADDGWGYYSWITSGIIWAADNGAKVINMSLGGSDGSATLEDAINYAWSKGVVIVAAAGNSGESSPKYPAYYSNVIAVAATDQNDNKASFSTYGGWVDVASPGVSIYSTLPNHASGIGTQNYGTLQGTSMAAPFVTGLAALVWATPNGTSNGMVRNQIEASADRIAGTGTYWQFGRINAYRAVSTKFPEVETLAATGIGASTAVLNGNLFSLGSATSAQVSFEYGTDTTYGSSTPAQTMTATGSFSANIGALTAGSYYFRAKATTASGTVYGLPLQFSTVGNTLTSSANPGGTISPSGTIWVAKGGSQTYTVTPNPGQHVVSLVVDGTAAGAADSYTFSNVTADHSIKAFFSSGNAYAWGLNSNGQLGDGTTVDRASPVDTVNLDGAVAITGSERFTAALKSDGTVWMWGINDGAQLGDDTPGYRPYPAPVPGLAGVTAIASVSGKQLALMSDGTVRVWGSGATTPDLHDITAVSAGGGHFLALRSDGTVWGWGTNNLGQLGDGTTKYSGTPVQAVGLTGVIAIATGSNHSFAIKSDGTVWGWGVNDNGHLGDGTGTNHLVPTLISGLTGVVAIAGGSNHSLFLKSDGTVWGTGWGGVGDGTSEKRYSPVQTIGLSGVVAIEAYDDQSLALKSDGTVWAWGAFGTGFAGNTPVKVDGLENIGALGAGRSAGYALKGLRVATSAASSIGTTTATLNGNLSSLGTSPSVSVSFQWSTAPGTYPNETPPSVMTTTGAFAANLSGLTANGTYYFRAKAAGSVVAYGSELSFTASGGANGTFGLNAGNATWPEAPGTLQAMRFQNTAGTGTLTKLELQFNQASGSGNVMLGIYSDNNGTPASLLGSGQTAAGSGWVSVSGLSVPVTANSFYWLAYDLQNANTVAYQGAQAAGSHVWGNAAYGALPATFPAIQYTNGDQYVMRATVTSGSGGAVLPTVLTKGSASIGVTSATINGYLAALGSASSVSVSFQWGTAPGSYPNQTAAQALTAAGPFSANLSSLSPGMVYYFRAGAISGGTVYGDELSFTTPAQYTISSSAGTGGTISPAGGVKVNPGGSQTFTIAPSVEYRIDRVTVDGVPVGAVASYTLAGVTANHTIAASFAPASSPLAVNTAAAGNVADIAATLNGNLVSLGSSSAVNVSFEYGPTTEYGSTIAGTPTSLTAPGAFAANVSGLAASTLYHFRAKAEGGSGVVTSGADMTFTTKTPPSVSTNIFEVLRPNGPGSETTIDYQYPATGEHWDKMDEAVPDEDGAYIANGSGPVAVLQRDLYAIQDHSMGTGTIGGITITVRAKTNGALVYISLKTRGEVYDYNDHLTISPPSPAYYYDVSRTMPVNPYTGTAWTWADIDSLEAGVSLGGPVNMPSWSRATQVYVSVEYAALPTANGAVLKGTLSSLGTNPSASVSFLWGTSSGSLTQQTPAQVLTAPGVFSASLTGLSPNTTYFYRARAVGNGTTLGEIRSLTTLPGANQIAVVTNSATPVGTTAATLDGSLTGMGSAASVNVSFEYGLTASYGSSTAPQAKTTTGPFSANLTGLTPATLYHVRAKADGGTAGIAYGSDLTFTTTPPAVTTNAATAVGPTAATVNGSLTGLSGATGVHVSFEYGLTASYGSSTTSQTLTAAGPFSANITGLTPGALYHYRAKADGGSAGIGYGADQTFSTIAFVAPIVATSAASSIAATTAMLNGNLTGIGTAGSVTVSFEYGLTISYGNSAAGVPPTLSAPGTFTAGLTGLTPNTLYHYRAKAAGDGTAYGGDQTFTTTPSVTTNAASAITATTAMLNGNLNAGGNASSVKVSFEYGLTSSYGSTTPEQAMTAPGAFSASVTGLTPGATYYFRAKAVGAGIYYGNQLTLVTLPANPLLSAPSSEILRPNGAGSETSLDLQYPSSGAHWDKVADVIPDEDGSYVENTNVFMQQPPWRDLYAIQDHSVGPGSIGGVTIIIWAKTNGASLAISLKTHGQVYDYNDHLTILPPSSPTSYYQASRTLSLNPYTGAAWTWDEVDALEAGVSLGPTSASPHWSRATQVYVAVDYTPVTSNSALLRGVLTSLGTASSVNVSFQWGTQPGTYTGETPVQVMTATGAFSYQLTGLTPGAPYYYRAKAVGVGTTLGEVRSFTTSTSSSQISVATNAAAPIGSTTATLNGSLTSLGSATSANVSFEYGLTTSYGTSTPAKAMAATGPFSANLTGLAVGTLYHFRARVDGGAAGVAYGADQTFTTTAVQTRLVTVAPNMVSPGGNISMTAAVYQLPGLTPVTTAGMPVQFNYVIYNLEAGTSQSGSTSATTNASGTATLSLTAPMARSVVLIDAVFPGSGSFVASSNMKIISVLPIIEARITATSTLGSITFHLADQYGNAMASRTLSFLTTAGTLSAASGVTNASGDVAVTLSGTTSAVVSGSFGGFTSTQGWAYQPTMARITVYTAATSNIQTRLVTAAPNMVVPGDNITMTATVYQLPGVTPVATAGMPVQFNYVIYNLETGTSHPDTTTSTTDASGTATLSLAAPMARSVVLVDAVFTGSGSFLASSNMKIISVLPIIEAKITATSTWGSITFHLADQYGNPGAGLTLSFLTTGGSLSATSGVTNVFGDVTVTLSGTVSAVVCASFGGYIFSAQGWAYQPTMARITILP